ncbi:MAG: hypothetical protein H7X77_09005 [Anaerolineae bacterium]|nr:hypothetical protein [Anaerolineae bacterium]
MASSIRKTIIIGLLFLLLTMLTVAQDTGTYQVEIDPANFVAVIDNPYYPHIAGMKWVYEGQTADGLERVEIEILAETRDIMGVQTTVMRDTVYVADAIVEDTLDFFAQDQEGNVWYFGEEVQNFDNGQLTDTAGSWEAGVDGALPGIVMFGDPTAHTGETYLQEYYVGEAEDAAMLLSVRGTVTVPYGTFEDVVMTYDFNPLDAESHEIKFFAAGIGEIKTVDLVTGEAFVLLEHVMN